MYVGIYIYVMYVCMHGCMYVFMYVCMYVCMYMYNTCSYGVYIYIQCICKYIGTMASWVCTHRHFFVVGHIVHLLVNTKHRIQQHVECPWVN